MDGMSDRIYSRRCRLRLFRGSRHDRIYRKIAESAYLRNMNPHEVTVGEALQLYLRKSPLKPRLDEYRVQAKWEQVMGKTIARYTTSLQLIRRKLFITTPVASLKQELSY